MESAKEDSLTMDVYASAQQAISKKMELAMESFVAMVRSSKDNRVMTVIKSMAMVVLHSV